MVPALVWSLFVFAENPGPYDDVSEVLGGIQMVLERLGLWLPFQAFLATMMIVIAARFFWGVFRGN